MTSGREKSANKLYEQPLNSFITCALDNVNDGVLAVDFSGKVILFNREAEKITGFGSDSIIGTSYDKLPFFVAEGISAKMSGVLSGREESSAVFAKSVCPKNAENISVESRIQPVCGSDGRVSGAVEIFSDPTAINELKEEVSKSRTLSALGEMSANVAHEIRNPLGSIGGFATLLERDLEDDDPRRNLVKKIIEGVASLDKIVTNLLIFTRPLKADLKQTNLVEYVEEVLDYLEVEIESQELPIQIKRKFPNKEIKSKIDPSLMQQVLLNIFRNAVYAMKSSGGCLTIGLSLHRNGEALKGSKGKVKFSGAQLVELLVADEGDGMSEEVQKKIFNPFFTTREDGTGLGLAISKKMILEQSGTIKVVSEVGVGTKISIFLPYCP